MKHKHTLLNVSFPVNGFLSLGIKLIESDDPAVIVASAEGNMKHVCLLVLGVMTANPCFIAYAKDGTVLHHMHPNTGRPASDLEAQEVTLMLDKITDAWAGKPTLPQALLNALDSGMRKVMTPHRNIPGALGESYPDDDDSKLDDDLACKVNVAADLIGKSIN